MKLMKLMFTLLLLTLAVAPAGAQMSAEELARIDEQVAVMEATLARLNPELAALERALNDPEMITWMTADGWRSASMSELADKVAFVQIAASRPEARDRMERIAGMELPATLAETASERTNRPARRLVRDWADAEGAQSQKEVGAHLQGLKRTIKTTESWLAEHRAVQQAARKPAAQAAAYPQGSCHIPAGKWQVGDTREVLEVVSDYYVVARKTKGSRNVPAGELAFYIQPRTCDAGVQTADEGFVNPTWNRSRVEVRWIEPGTEFSIEWPGREAITYTKVE